MDSCTWNDDCWLAKSLKPECCKIGPPHTDLPWLPNTHVQRARIRKKKRTPIVIAIPGLFNTGVTDIGTAVPINSPDPHYVLTFSAENVGTLPKPATVISHPFGINDTHSGYIGPAPFGDVEPGEYHYTTTFNLIGCDPTTASIKLAFYYYDNTIIDVLLNGVDTGIPGPTPPVSTWFTISSGFVTGINTLKFVVGNNPGYSSRNPTGFKIQMTSQVTSFV